MQIVWHILVGAGMIALTVLIHAAFMVSMAERLRQRPPGIDTYWKRAGLIIAMIIWLFLAICLECWAWALLFLYLDCFQTLEAALYFSVVTFTTLGYGDVLLTEEWRLLGAFAAANGTIIVGWTTALVFLAVQRVYRLHHPDRPDDAPPAA